MCVYIIIFSRVKVIENGVTWCHGVTFGGFQWFDEDSNLMVKNKTKTLCFRVSVLNKPSAWHPLSVYPPSCTAETVKVVFVL